MVIPVCLALYRHGQHKHQRGSPWCSPQGTFWRSCQSLHVSTCFKFHRSQLWFEVPQIPKMPFFLATWVSIWPFDDFPRRAARKDHLGRPRGKATKETVGKGYLIGEAALYGEAYPFGGLTGGCWGVHGRGGFKHLVWCFGGKRSNWTVGSNFSDIFRL